MGNVRTWALAALAVVAMAFVAGCGEQDPGALSATGVGGLSTEGQRQEYTEAVGRALQQLGAAQGQSFGRAIELGNKKQLQASAIAWEQGVEQLKQIDPPKDVVGQHTALVKAVETLNTWNKRLVAAAPNKTRTRKIGKAASTSPASQQFAGAICDIIDVGYDIADSSACTPLGQESAQSPAG